MSLKNSIEKCMLKDRRSLRKQLARRLTEKEVDNLKNKIIKSSAVATARQQNLPRVNYYANLPISQYAEKIKKSIIDNQVLIIAGDTGSGKTTQIPKICLEAGRGVFGKIAHTQPRRIAARSVAHRIADELGQSLGEDVGFKVRFAESARENSYIKVVTDGILLNEVVADPWLEEYDTIIIDEAHERSLNIDFLLGIIKGKLLKRKDLKVIITSATIDPVSFSKYFNDAPVIEIPGRTFPVEIKYLDENKVEFDDKILHAINNLPDRGDILVFLSGEGEIHQVKEMLNKKQFQNTEILPLFSRLSWQKQQLIFKPSKSRKIILSTNLAETSITVPGIKYVIDSGTARVSRYNYRSRMQRLPIERISKASAKQRAGRCGRTEPGICIRLYSEDDFSLREEFNEPEITRTNLATIILVMLGMRLGDIESFPFMLSPQTKVIKDGLRLLEQIKAIDKSKNITNIGRNLLKFPLDPQLSIMLHHAKEQKYLKDILIVVSGLSVGDVRERPKEYRDAADLAHKVFQTDTSDFASMLLIWEWASDIRKIESNNKLKKACKDNFISYQRLIEWFDVHQQLVDTCKDLNWVMEECKSDDATLHTIILYGLFNNIGALTADLNYQGANNKKFLIFPGSTLKQKKPKWIVANEIVETSNIYARTIAKIEPDWILKSCAHLIKYHYEAPIWHEKPGRVLAKEQASIFGLFLYKDKNVNFDRIDKRTSKLIMILHMLVRGEGADTKNWKFYNHNQNLLGEIKDLEDRQRQDGIYIADEEVLVEAYDSILPDNITDRIKFVKWLKHNDDRLYFSKDSLYKNTPEISEIKDIFPDYMQVGGKKYELDYIFKPNSEVDGITVYIPSDDLFTLNDQHLGWGVPGNLKERISFLLKSLPKQVRVDINPIQVLADAVFSRLITKINIKEDILQAINREVLDLIGVDIPLSRFNVSELPEHLKMKVAVIDNNGNIISRGDSVNSLIYKFKKDLNLKQNNKVEQKNNSNRNRDRDVTFSIGDKSYSNWDFDNIDSPKIIASNNMNLTKYIRLVRAEEPGLVRLHDYLSADEGNIEHNICIAILLKNQDDKNVKYLLKQLDKKQKLILDSYEKKLVNDMATAIYLSEFVDKEDIVLTNSSFAGLCIKDKTNLYSVFINVAVAVANTLVLLKEVNCKINALNAKDYETSILDIKEQMELLFADDFLLKAPVESIYRYPVFMKAILRRLEKLPSNLVLDKSCCAQIKKYMSLLKLNKSYRKGCLADIRWDLEDLRISLFAQELKTIKKVSCKRLDVLVANLR